MVFIIVIVTGILYVMTFVVAAVAAFVVTASAQHREVVSEHVTGPDVSLCVVDWVGHDDYPFGCHVFLSR